jgi:hypothetical protein
MRAEEVRNRFKKKATAQRLFFRQKTQPPKKIFFWGAKRVDEMHTAHTYIHTTMDEFCIHVLFCRIFSCCWALISA